MRYHIIASNGLDFTTRSPLVAAIVYNDTLKTLGLGATPATLNCVKSLSPDYFKGFGCWQDGVGVSIECLEN